MQLVLHSSGFCVIMFQVILTLVSAALPAFTRLISTSLTVLGVILYWGCYSARWDVCIVAIYRSPDL